MNYLEKSFIYLSQIIGMPVIDFNTTKKIGRIVEVVTVLKEA